MNSLENKPPDVLTFVFFCSAALFAASADFCCCAPDALSASACLTAVALLCAAFFASFVSGSGFAAVALAAVALDLAVAVEPTRGVVFSVAVCLSAAFDLAAVTELLAPEPEAVLATVIGATGVGFVADFFSAAAGAVDLADDIGVVRLFAEAAAAFPELRAEVIVIGREVDSRADDTDAVDFDVEAARGVADCVAVIGAFAVLAAGDLSADTGC